MAGTGRETILKFALFESSVDEGFWHRLSSLKLNTLRLDESPLPITGFYAPCSHPQVSNRLTLLAESLPSEESPSLLACQGNRNRCPVPGILLNTNTLESFYALDKQSLLKTEAKKIWDDIYSGSIEEDPSLLLRFLVISFADLKKWSFHYWFAFPALLLDPPATLVNLKPASQCFTSEEAESLSRACNEWRNTSSTAELPFFLVSIGPNSIFTLRHLRELEACQNNGQKVLFGFYDPCHLPNNPGWPLRNYLAYICLRWGSGKIHFFCYRENHGFADLELSLVGEAAISLSQGWWNHQNMPNVVGWELNKGKKVSRCINLAKTMDPTRNWYLNLGF